MRDMGIPLESSEGTYLGLVVLKTLVPVLAIQYCVEFAETHFAWELEGSDV
jgi:hypothetical protein